MASTRLPGLALAALCAASFFFLPAAAGEIPLRHLVLEDEGRQLTILDGESRPISRIATGSPVAGEPGFSPDGRYAYVATRDGRVIRYDLVASTVVAEARAGTESNGLAVSSDGKVVAVANRTPHAIAFFDAELGLIKTLPVSSKDRRITSGVAAIYDAAPRRSFVVALEGIREIWEISYVPTAPEVPIGVIHDFKYREGAFIPGYLNPQRTYPDGHVDDYAFTRDCDEVVGTLRETGRREVFNLDARKKIADLGPASPPALRQAAPRVNRPGPQGACGNAP